jgi:tetratricopeptide (TPR) repeat protein
VGYICYMGYDFGFSHDDATLRRAGQHASRALELDAELSLAWLAGGLEQYKRGDFPRAASLLRRAVALDRNEDAIGFLAAILAAAGRDEEARVLVDEMAARSPFHPLAAVAAAIVHCYTGRFPEAVAACRGYLARASGEEPIVIFWLAQAEAFAGREAVALEHLQRVVDMGAGTLGDMSEMLARALRSDADGARAWFTNHPLLGDMAKTDEWFPNFLATAFAHIGEHDRALECLEYGVAWGFSCHRFLAEHNRFLAPLRGDPRFEALLEKARAQERAFPGAT